MVRSYETAQVVSAGIFLTEPWDWIVLMQSEKNLDLVGLTFAEIVRKRGVAPYDAALDLLLDEGATMDRLMWTSQSILD